jgi:hypothetical protein
METFSLWGHLSSGHADRGRALSSLKAYTFAQLNWATGNPASGLILFQKN